MISSGSFAGSVRDGLVSMQHEMLIVTIITYIQFRLQCCFCAAMYASTPNSTVRTVGNRLDFARIDSSTDTLSRSYSFVDKDLVAWLLRTSAMQ